MELTFTDKAANKTAELIKAEGDDLLLRTFVQGGGCSGFQYGFTFEQKANDADWKIIANNGVILLIDPISMQYLKGSTIDYEDNVLKGSAFIIKNPNAKSTCGCGSSFTT